MFFAPILVNKSKFKSFELETLFYIEIMTLQISPINI